MVKERVETAELMPIVWRLGTDRTYRDYLRANDLENGRQFGCSW